MKRGSKSGVSEESITRNKILRLKLIKVYYYVVIILISLLFSISLILDLIPITTRTPSTAP